MNVTFLLGNGFDLNLGFKTSYCDFLNEYVNIESDNQIIQQFKTIIKKDCEGVNSIWSDAELAMGEYSREFEGEEARENFLLCLEDFENALRRYLQNLPSEIFQKNIGKLANDFAIAINDYTKDFRFQVKNTLLSSEYNPTANHGYFFQFVIFNYTQFADYLLLSKHFKERLFQFKHHSTKIAPIFAYPLHIHGTMSKDMIFGLDNTAQIKNSKLFNFDNVEDRGNIVKKDAIDACENGTYQKLLSIFEQTDLFYLYGLSIGDTDSSYWKRIIRLMESRKNVRTIIHAMDAPCIDIERRKNRSFCNNLKNKFLAHSQKDSESAESVYSRIHIADFNIFSKLENGGTKLFSQENAEA